MLIQDVRPQNKAPNTILCLVKNPGRFSALSQTACLWENIMLLADTNNVLKIQFFQVIKSKTLWTSTHQISENRGKPWKKRPPNPQIPIFVVFWCLHLYMTTRTFSNLVHPPLEKRAESRDVHIQNCDTSSKHPTKNTHTHTHTHTNKHDTESAPQMFWNTYFYRLQLTCGQPLRWGVGYSVLR